MIKSEQNTCFLEILAFEQKLDLLKQSRLRTLFCCGFFFYFYNFEYQGSINVSGEGRVVRWCLVNFQYRGVLLIWVRVGQGPTALAVGAVGGCLDIFSLVCHFFLPNSGRRPEIMFGWLFWV